MSEDKHTEIIIDHNTSKLGPKPSRHIPHPVIFLIIGCVAYVCMAFAIHILFFSNPTSSTKKVPTPTPSGPVTCRYFIPSKITKAQATVPYNGAYLTSRPGGSEVTFRPIETNLDEFYIIYTYKCSDGSTWLYSVMSDDDGYFWWEFPESGYINKSHTVSDDPVPTDPQNCTITNDPNFINRVAKIQNGSSVQAGFHISPDSASSILFSMPHDQTATLKIYATAKCQGSTWWYVVTQGRHKGWLNTSEIDILIVVDEP